MRTDEVTALIVDVCERLILPRFRNLAAGEVEQKRPGDLVTVADREAEAALTAVFRAATPDALVVGEEATFVDASGVAGLADAAHAWVIDPVDGTRNFAAGSEDFGVMVAEVRAGVTTRSWIWQPIHRALYVAERGAGATCNGDALAPLEPRDRPWRAAVWPRASRQQAPGWEMRRTRGSCAIDYPGLATGGVDALAYGSLHPWDHLAGVLLVREVGGDALVAGRPYAAGVTGALLTAGASTQIADALAARLSG